MKKFLLLIVLLPLGAIAQNYPDMDFKQMQQFYQQAQKAQECYQQIPEEKRKQLEQKGMKLNNDAKKLCTAGKRAEAQKLAMKFAFTVSQDKTMLDIKNCAELLQGLQLAALPLMSLDQDFSTYHICDIQQ